MLAERTETALYDLGRIETLPVYVEELDPQYRMRQRIQEMKGEASSLAAASLGALVAGSGLIYLGVQNIEAGSVLEVGVGILQVPAGIFFGVRWASRFNRERRQVTSRVHRYEKVEKTL